MKTVYAPDTAANYAQALHDLAMANPVLAYGALVAVTMLAAAKLARFL